MLLDCFLITTITRDDNPITQQCLNVPIQEITYNIQSRFLVSISLSAEKEGNMPHICKSPHKSLFR